MTEKRVFAKQHFNEREYLRIKEVSKLYGVSRSTIYKTIEDGLINRYYLNKTPLIKREELEKLIRDSKS